ncbi:MAG: TonB-dependent receptor, partial [Verrucomicrobiaceae bacterium]
ADPAAGTVATLEEIIVEGRSDSLVGVASSANEGVVGREQLALRPLLRPGEIVETIPGVIVSQHSGAGKANQFYLRGFNLDHGTDLLTSLEGVPINMRSHAHGQGYTDLNFLVPEFVQQVEYRKGPYYPEYGDFASAGAFNIGLINRLEQGFLTLEGGTDGYARLVFANSVDLGVSQSSFSKGPDGKTASAPGTTAPLTLLYGLELYHYDGPWKNPDDYQRINGLMRLSSGDQALGWTITAMAYHGDWTATDQIPRRAVRDIGLYGSLDESTGGDSSRYSLQGEWHRADEDSATKLLLYGLYYDLDLFSNFTYFLDDPENGDQFEQKDRRIHWGAQASHTLFGELFGKETANTFGLQFRQDHIRNGLFHTRLRERLETIRQDRIIESSIGLYYSNRTKWTSWFRTEAGVRADYFHFDVDSNLGINSGSEDDIIASPKLSLIFGPWYDTEIYLNGGLGYHSNDARGVITRFDPVEGARVNPADPLVRTKGAEIGVRTTVVKGLQSSLALWVLDIDSELLFVGDAGTTEATRPSTRWGVEWANYYQPTPWLTIDADFAWSQARFSDSALEGQRIPGSIETVFAAGISVHDLPGFWNPWTASLRLRYFGPRDLIEDSSVRSESTTLVNAQIGYRFNDTWSASVQVLNLFDSDILIWRFEVGLDEELVR